MLCSPYGGIAEGDVAHRGLPGAEVLSTTARPPHPPAVLPRASCEVVMRALSCGAVGRGVRCSGFPLPILLKSSESGGTGSGDTPTTAQT